MDAKLQLIMHVFPSTVQPGGNVEVMCEVLGAPKDVKPTFVFFIDDGKFETGIGQNPAVITTQGLVEAAYKVRARVYLAGGSVQAEAEVWYRVMDNPVAATSTTVKKGRGLG